MMDLTELQKLNKIYPIKIEKYEQYIPDLENGDIVFKMNGMVQYLNNIGKLTSNVVSDWNRVMEWVLNDGLTESTSKQVDEYFNSTDFINLVEPALEEVRQETLVELEDIKSGLAQTQTQKADKSEVANGLNAKRDKSVPVGLNDMDSETLAAIQGGEGTTFSLLSVPRPGSVRPGTTTFINKSTNLYGKIHSGKALDPLTGELVNNPQYFVSDFESVKAGVQYVYRKIDRVVFYDENYNYISVRNFEDTENPSLYTTPALTQYIRAHSFHTRVGEGQINEGSTLLPYEKWYEYLPERMIEKVSVKKVDGLNVSKEIDYEDTPLRYNAKRFLNSEWETGTISSATGANVSSSYILRTKDFFQPKEDWTINLLDNKNYKYGWAVYELDGTFVSLQAYFTDAKRERSLDSTKKYKLILTTSAANTSLTNLVDETASKLVVTEGKLQVKPYYVVPEKISTEWYQAPTMTGLPSISEITINDVYSKYDALVSAYPNYITRTLLGNDQSGAYPIYKYEFNPVTVNSSGNFDKQLPKIILVTGTHGEEKGSTMSLLKIMEQVCNNWQDHSILEYLRFNVRFVIVPLVNPYGHANTIRQNVNGVDINRNVDYMWQNAPSDPTNPAYKGTAPFSEVESQYIRDLIHANLDAVLFMDYHTNAAAGKTYDSMIYCALNTMHEKPQILAKYMMDKTTREGQKRYGIPTNLSDGTIGSLDYGNTQPFLANYAAFNGLPGFIAECTPKFPEGTGLDAKTMQFNTEYFTNMLANTVRLFLES